MTIGVIYFLKMIQVDHQNPQRMFGTHGTGKLLPAPQHEIVAIIEFGERIKNTKDFQKGWIEKLKNDQREASANLAVIMSIALPSEIDSFGIYQDVWVTDYKSVIGLAMALRQSLVNLKRSEIIQANQASLKDVIW